MKHTCHAFGCPIEVPRKMFMGRSHWYQLPKPMRDAVWANYNPGQEQGKADVTTEYLKVTDQCIKYIREKEGK